MATLSAPEIVLERYAPPLGTAIVLLGQAKHIHARQIEGLHQVLGIADVIDEGPRQPLPVLRCVGKGHVGDSVTVLLYGIEAGECKIDRIDIDRVSLGRDITAEHGPLVAHHAVELPLGRHHRRHIIPVWQIHLDIVVGGTQQQIHAVDRAGLELKLGTGTGGIGVEGYGVDTGNVKGLVILVVIVVGRAVKPGQPAHDGRLEPDLVGIEVLRT